MEPRSVTVEARNASPEAPALLEVSGLAKSFSSRSGTVHAIEGLDFAVRNNEFLSVVGPSGCGKTTLLMCLSGLMSPTSGRAMFEGAPVTGPPRNLAIVFQDYRRSLFPWMTVRKNVILPLTNHVSKAEAQQRASDALSAVGLADAADRHPWQLSGGMQQRVAIARAVAYRPKLLLLDEPFASVDAQTRSELQDLVLTIRDAFGITTLLVTHDIDEAVYLSDRIVVLSRQPARVVQSLVVNLPTHRDQIATKELPEFVALRARLYRAITDAHVPASGPVSSLARVAKPVINEGE
jgi:NitT/TauT family transport system ATP-binding protein